MSKVTVTRAAECLRLGMGFTTRTGLSAESFYRLSPDPRWVGGLNGVQRMALLHARQINAAHYLPYCRTCGETVEFDHRAEARVWVHKAEVGKEHLPDVAQHPDSYNVHPDGLAYVVWSGTDVLAWATNAGRVTHIPGDTHVRHRELVHDTMGEQIPPRKAP